MRFLFPDPTYTREHSTTHGQFAADLRREAASVFADYKIAERNLGRGGDWPMLVLAFAILFASGKKINENIDGWLGLASKLRDLWTWLRSKCSSQWVDEEASALLALRAVADAHSGGIASIDLVSSVFIPSAQVLLASGDPPDFQPVGVYIHAYQINRHTTYAVVVRSTGVVEAAVAVTPDNPFEH
jgi:hypothetical protein